VLWCLISVSGVVAIGRGGVAIGGGVVGDVVNGGGMMNSMMSHGGGVVNSMVSHGGGVVNSMMSHHRGVVNGVVGGGVVDSVGRSTEVGESSEGHVRAGSHEGDESNQGKGLHDVLMC